LKNKELLKAVHKAMDDKFGEEITILDISNLSVMADYFVITHGNNPNQVKAIADEVRETCHKAGIKINHSEGYDTATWILLDFSDIIVHIFNKEDREFYNIERVWADAEIVNV